MPSYIQVAQLKDICIQNLINNIDVYWMRKTKIESLIESSSKLLYLIGPFESLHDSHINYILKKIYESKEKKRAKLTRFHVYLCLNTHLKKLDFSFIKRANIIDAKLCSFIGFNSNVSINSMKALKSNFLF